MPYKPNYPAMLRDLRNALADALGDDTLINLLDKDTVSLACHHLRLMSELERIKDVIGRGSLIVDGVEQPLSVRVQYEIAQERAIVNEYVSALADLRNALDGTEDLAEVASDPLSVVFYAKQQLLKLRGIEPGEDQHDRKSN